MRTLRKVGSEKAITLIALVVTIVILLILAGVSIPMLTGTNGILTQAQKAKLSTELSSYKEQLELYKTEKLSENRDFLESTLTVGKESLTYNTQPEGETGNIKTVIPNIKDEYIDKVEIIKGSLLINTQDKNEIEIAKSLGIAANPYDIVNGELLSSNGNLLLMDETGTLTIPDSVTKIGEGAFANLEGLKTIIIPGTVKEIGTNAFAYNSTLETVIMQEGVEVIGNKAFSNCTKIKKIELPLSLTNIYGDAFNRNDSLERIVIPGGVKEIGGSAFTACAKLKEVILSNGLESIGGGAFVGTIFRTITIPSTVKKIGKNVFDNNKNLNDIQIENNEGNYIYQNGMLMTRNKNDILFISDAYLKSITILKIPEGIKKFGLDISGYTNIIKLIIPTSLNEPLLPRALPYTIADIEVEKGNTTFQLDKDKKLLYTIDTKMINICFSKEENIDLKDENNELGILSLYDSSFQQATNAKNIILPNSLTAISNFVFQNCKKIETIKIGRKVKFIASMFKYNYTGSVIIDSQNPYYIIENNILYNKEKTKLYTVLYEINGIFSVINGVEEIADSAFHGQYKLSEIEFPETLKKIGNSFGFCYALTGINIPGSVTNISESAFGNCNNLSNINVNNKRDSIIGAPWGAPKGLKIVNWNR